MPPFFSYRSAMLWTFVLAVCLLYAGEHAWGFGLLCGFVYLYVASGYQKIFQKGSKAKSAPRRSIAAEVAQMPIDGPRETGPGFVGRLDPAWQVWLHQEGNEGER